jgi:hypothetical protein
MRRAIMVRLIIIFTITAAMIFTGSYHDVQGQAERKVECGDVIESEFTKNFEEHIYLITMNARDSFSVALSPVGDFLQTGIGLYGPTGIQMGRSNAHYMSKSPSVTSGILSARGVYKIQVVNAGIDSDGGICTGDMGGVGIYTLYIECEQINAIPTPSATVESTESTESAASLPKADLQPLFEVNKTYEIVLPSSTYLMKVINLRSDGWVQVEYNNKVSWLNSNQVVLVTLIED